MSKNGYSLRSGLIRDSPVHRATGSGSHIATCRQLNSMALGATAQISLADLKILPVDR